MEHILYLSYSNNQEGLVFPNELEEGVYAPGMWVIQAENLAYIKDTYFIDAVHNEEVIQLFVKRVNKTLYQVETVNYGNIFLRLSKIYSRYNFYVGNSPLIKEDSSFFQLIPIDIPKLTELCLAKRFFLIGKIDEEIKKPSYQQRI